MPGKQTVHLVDASPYIFRAYFSLPSSLVDPEGRSVNGVYGFANFLLKLIAEEGVTHLAVTFDESLTTSFRNEIYPEYKAQRELPPPELEAQLKDCQAVASALGAATFVDDRYEADDLIGTLCGEMVAEGHRVVIVTSDKDLAQLVGEAVAMFDFGKGERLGTAEVIAKFGVRPQQIADYLGLAGDSVDNIPGVKGVGAKTAAALLAEFADLEAIYGGLERVAELPIRGARSVTAKLDADREMAFLSRELATVATDVPTQADLQTLAYEGADRRAVETLFARLGFERIQGRITRWQK